MEFNPFSLSKFLSGLVALAKAEFGTVVGRINLLFALILAVLVYALQDKILSQSTLEWALEAGVGGNILIPLVLGVVLVFLMILASLFLTYRETTGRK